MPIDELTRKWHCRLLFGYILSRIVIWRARLLLFMHNWHARPACCAWFTQWRARLRSIEHFLKDLVLTVTDRLADWSWSSTHETRAASLFEMKTQTFTNLFKTKQKQIISTLFPVNWWCGADVDLCNVLYFAIIASGLWPRIAGNDWFLYNP